MKIKRILGIWLILLMLIITACGRNENTASATVQEPETTIQEYESSVQEDSSAVQDDIPEAEETESKKEVDTEVQDETEAQVESGIQVQTYETYDFGEDSKNNNLPTYGDYYYDVENVVLYLEAYDELPPNYITKNEAQALGWEGGSVEKYKEGAAIGGDTFGNREGLLPVADGRKYTECDIDTLGYNSRGSRRLVFSNDGLYFYTSDHYENFSEITVTEDYEVIW